MCVINRTKIFFFIFYFFTLAPGQESHMRLMKCLKKKKTCVDCAFTHLNNSETKQTKINTSTVNSSISCGALIKLHDDP